MTELYQGAEAPETYQFFVTPGTSGLDLSTVSAASFKVLKPGAAAYVTWTATMSNQTPTTLTLTHDFSVAPSELDVAGEYKIYARLTVPGGFLNTDRVRRLVRSTSEVP